MSGRRVNAVSVSHDVSFISHSFDPSHIRQIVHVTGAFGSGAFRLHARAAQAQSTVVFT